MDEWRDVKKERELKNQGQFWLIHQSGLQIVAAANEPAYEYFLLKVTSDGVADMTYKRDQKTLASKLSGTINHTCGNLEEEKCFSGPLKP